MNCRMKYHFKYIFFLLLGFTSFFANAQSLDKEGIPIKPNPPHLVNDFAGILSENNKALLEAKLVAYHDSTSTQITIVTINTTGDYPIEDYALRLGRNWGIGQKGENNGLLILVAKDDRKVRIEVGYGLEEYITDYDSKEINDDILIPAFKQNQFYAGLDDATNRIIAQIQGTFKPSPKQNTEIPLWVIILIIIILLIVLSSLSKNRSMVSIGGGGWTWTSGGGGSSWSGGGGGGGGFGGFGGGSFGGGGSSGSW